MEFWLEPRPDDRTDHTRAPLSRPSRHSKNNSRTRISLGREEPKDGHAFSPGGPFGQSRVCPSPYRRAPICPNISSKLLAHQPESIPDESFLQLTILQPENPSSFELISQFEKDSKNVLNKNEFSGPLNALDIGAYDLGLGSFVSIQEGPNEEQNSGHQANHEKSSSIQKRDQTQGEQCSDYDSFAYNHFPFNVQDLRTNIFEEGGNDAPQSMDQYMEPAQHGD
ncbi:hypothetical protein F2Q68_00031969 [Brassica cretica]|uniref:Uncharacterized protein n=1 Tax=Brassica cretica TaxID=69181 RepID=A0A8S9G5P3_BRACR|nr:hypothetical protein F2Q68_00031969 [Brassica cretica]